MLANAAFWLLERLGVDPALVGDLFEERHDGRAVWWLRRQILWAIVAGVQLSARRNRQNLAAVAAGWSLQLCAVAGIQHFGLMPQGHGLLWRAGGCLAILVLCAFYGAAKGSIRALAGRRATLEIGCDAFSVNLAIFYLFVFVGGFSQIGPVVAEVIWLLHDMGRVLLAGRTPC